MNEVAMNNEELEETFQKAANHLQALIPKLDKDQLLYFYGLYKQATCGPCNVPSPNWYQMQAKSKWQSWKNLESMPSHEAMFKYITGIDNINPEWKNQPSNTTNSWVVFSRLSNTDEEIKDEDKTLLDYVKDCNELKVQEKLLCSLDEIFLQDEDGMFPIHWAADRGNVLILQYLVEAGSNINARDNQGQTPLHYAAFCGHEGAIKYLLSNNANILKDDSGSSPKSIADETVSSMF